MDIWRRGIGMVWRGGAGSEEADAPARWWMLPGFGSLLLAGAILRLWDLGSRAMHHDESLHAYYAWNLYNGSGYQHDPMMHGPFQMEASASIFFLLGDSDFTARLLYAIAGTALVVLPYFFRSRLGNLGALCVSALLALSPTMLYFSRFARNDILMAVWTLGLVICMWRYIDEGRNRYLYIGAAILSLAFATKENAYLVTATLGLYLVLLVTKRNWPAIRQGITVGEVSPPVAIQRIVLGGWSVLTRGLALTGISRPAGFLVLLITLTLPLWAAFVSVLQDTPLLSRSDLVLANPVGGTGPIGAPSRGGLVIATLTVMFLFWISASMGFRWSRSVWWRCALIFYAVFVLLYSTAFTNMAGLGSGVWQSLGYWLVQQGEARGGQPWYYYLVITPTYEFLPLLLAVAGGIYYLRRNDSFGRFLVFWAGTTFVLYTIASEKMPWLSVNVALPLIVLGGRFLGDILLSIRWRRLVSGEGLFLLAGVPLFLVLAWRLAFFTADAWDLSNVLVLGALVVMLAALAAVGLYVLRHMGYREFAAAVSLPLVAVLLVLSVRAGWYASYQNGDIPVEMLVYTQTSPDIVRLLRHVEQAGDDVGDRTGVPINVDQSSGFTWPWAWYLRDYNRFGLDSYENVGSRPAPDSSVVLVHASNQPGLDPLLVDGFTEGVRIKHRWWFPESYRGLTLGKFLGALADRQAWRRAMDYFLYRELGTPLGSEDAYVYFSKDFPSGFSPAY